MENVPTAIEEVSILLSANRPSHRQRLKEIFAQENGAAIVGEGARNFLSKWIDADWMDEGKIFYTGAMFAGMKNSPQLKEAFSTWVQPLAKQSEKGGKVIAAFMEGTGLNAAP